MRAVFIKEFGVDGQLEIRTLPDLPAPTGSSAMVRVMAAGLNRADLMQLRGSYPPPAGYSANIPGLEFAGVVESVGDEVRSYKTGDRVFGITAGEAQAEMLVIDERLLTPIPDNLSFVEAAAVPEAFITAHDAVVTQGRLQAGETLLIHAVGSGVGLAALQIAKAAGAFVAGTSRTADKLKFAEKFGLDLAILAGSELDLARVTAERGGANVILDLVGGGYFEQNLSALAVKGRLVLVGLTSGSTAKIELSLALRKRATIIGTVLRSRSVEEKADATKLFANEVVPLLADGTLTPNVDRTFAFEDAPSAYEYLRSNKSCGKVVLDLQS